MKHIVVVIFGTLLFSLSAFSQVRTAINRDWNTAATRKAIKKERNIGWIDDKGRSHLHLAAELNRGHQLPILLERLSSMLKTRDGDGLTPIEVAIVNGSISAFQALLPHYKAHQYRSKNKYGWTLAHWAARFNQPAILRELAKLDFNFNVLDLGETPWTPLDLALDSDSQAAVVVLRALGCVQAGLKNH